MSVATSCEPCAVNGGTGVMLATYPVMHSMSKEGSGAELKFGTALTMSPEKAKDSPCASSPAYTAMRFFDACSGLNASVVSVSLSPKGILKIFILALFFSFPPGFWMSTSIRI